MCTYNVSRVMKHSCYGKHQLLCAHFNLQDACMYIGQAKEGFFCSFSIQRFLKMVTKDNICIYTHVPIMYMLYIHLVVLPINPVMHMHNIYKSHSEISCRQAQPCTVLEYTSYPAYSCSCFQLHVLLNS